MTKRTLEKLMISRFVCHHIVYRLLSSSLFLRKNEQYKKKNKLKSENRYNFFFTMFQTGNL